MSQLPHIARRHLQAEAAGNHPDAGLLTGFVELALTATERETVLAHLASCTACREVVSLALPEEEVQQEAAGSPAPSWFRWPLLRWTAVAATVIAVWAAVAVLVPRTSNRDVSVPADSRGSESNVVAPEPTAPVDKNRTPRLRDSELGKQPANQMAAQNNPVAAPAPVAELNSAMAKKQVGAVAGAPQLHTLAAASPAASTVNGPLRKDVDSVNKDLDSVNIAGGRTTAVISGTITDPSGAVVPNALVKITDARTASSTDVRTDSTGTYRSPVAPGVYSVEAASPGFQTAKADDVSVDRALVAQNFTLRPGAATEMVEVTTAAPPPPPATADAVKPQMEQAMRGAAAMPKTKSLAMAPALHWRVSEGTVETSPDGSSWTKLRTAPSGKFQAVAALGELVWAGGEQGALFRSQDDGRTWTQIRIFADGSRFQGTITAMACTTPRDISVTTSSGQVFTSSDSGRTWQKHSAAGTPER